MPRSLFAPNQGVFCCGVAVAAVYEHFGAFGRGDQRVKWVPASSTLKLEVVAVVRGHDEYCCSMVFWAYAAGDSVAAAASASAAWVYYALFRL